MKQLSSFLALSVNGGDRISYTYDVISQEGDIEQSNVKESFVAVDSGLRGHVSAIREWIEANRLAE
jgi:hypothetical protein